VFLAIFKVKQCFFHIFHIFQFCHHIPGTTMCISYFSWFSVFLAIFHVLQCVFVI
jgi:hypothetical protein